MSIRYWQCECSYTNEVGRDDCGNCARSRRAMILQQQSQAMQGQQAQKPAGLVSPAAMETLGLINRPGGMTPAAQVDLVLENVDLRARIAELEAQHAEQAATIAGLQRRGEGMPCDREECCEAKGVRVVLEQRVLQAQEGERRKREECLRLEKHAAQANFDRAEARKALADAQTEIARLHRELRGKR